MALLFLITKDVDPGLLNVLEHEILPRLENEVPRQPSKEELEKDPLLHRFTLVFDREGYSPEFMKRTKDKRIACLTYNKHPGENWGEEEFLLRKVKLVSGEVVEMKLAERGVFIGKKVWVREIRRLMNGGHQTSILSTAYRSELEPQVMGMFARWSQENFFKYMRQHYNLDRLVEYSVEEVPETIRVVNPTYRRLEGEIKSKAGILHRKMAHFGTITIEGEIEAEKIEEYQKQKAELRQEITCLQNELEKLKAERKSTPRHIQLSELPEKERFQRLRSKSKDFLDTIKMIAYRTETAMVNIVREVMSREDDARSLVRSLYETEGDIIPDEKNNILRIRLHHQANRSADKALEHLCTTLNETETIFPGTRLRLFYEMVSSSNPRGQEV